MNGAKSSTATGTTGTAELPPRGRFAPSPTGPLHLGSLCTAVGSWLDARARGGQWLVRIEDVDRSRADRQRASQILGTLESFALTWDGPVLYQSERSEAYAQALARLAARDLIYACTCTRSELPPATEPEGEAVYPGTCRAGVTHPERAAALRLRVPAGATTVGDRRLGTLTQDLATCAGDFVVRRRDGSYAYPLAVVVDDAAQGITDVVRGADLWLQTPRQRLLQTLLGLPTPRYLHLPLVVEPDGSKLSKSRRSVAVTAGAAPQLVAVLRALGLPPPAAIDSAPPAELLQWAVQHWQPPPPSRTAIAAWPMW